MNYSYIQNIISRLTKKLNEVYMKVVNILSEVNDMRYNMEYDSITKTLKITNN